jgi:parallel beta-helix repeat protein
MRIRPGRLALAILLSIAATTGATAAVITEDTKLTANLVVTDTTTPAIRIAAPGVVLDLNGFSVSGPRRESGIGIVIEPGAYDVTIRGGTVTGFATAIYLPAETAGHKILSVTARRNSDVGIHCDGAANVEIAGCEAQDNGIAGILVENSRGANVHHNTVQDNGEAGLILGSGARGATVERNVSRFNDGIGILLSGGASANTIRRNTAAGNADFDLQDDNGDCDANLWFRNLFTTRNGDCID